MEKKLDPFAGVKLSDTVPAFTQGRDQRLFAQPSPATQQSTEQRQDEQSESPESRQSVKSASRKTVITAIRKAGKTETSIPGKPASRQAVKPDAGARFDINQEAAKKETIWCAQAETDALDDLKLELRRRLSLRASKQDIVRSAIQLAIEQYEREGERSPLVQRLRTKQRSEP